jgi:hypothetical protein
VPGALHLGRENRADIAVTAGDEDTHDADQPPIVRTAFGE